MSVITLLLNRNKQVCRIYAHEKDARAKAHAYNEDPFLDGGEPDPQAPYSWETWIVTENESAVVR